MKELVKSLFGSKDEQSSEMGAVFADIATTIRDEDEEQAQAEAEDDKAEATFAPFSLETVETDDGTVLYRIVGAEDIAQSDDYLRTRNGQGGATSWTELVRGALHLSGQAEILNDLWFRSTDEQFIAETANAADAAAVAGLGQAMHWDRAMMDAALDWAQKQGFWV